ncbi:hypothetical protein JYU16_00070 [bacterium AH-315-M05]|nr:hypothetical protein [bacterium AH-315-M05]
MKKLIQIYAMLFLVLTSHTLFAQQIGNLEGINYQAVAIDEDGKEIVGMDVNGKPLYNKAIGVRFTILSGSNGPVLYQETHTANTDQYGLFSLVIGLGTQTGAGLYTILMDIPWIDADQFLKVEIAINNDDDYKLVSLQKFMTVPYSFYTDDIADNAITTNKILNETILAEDIGTGSVETSEILDETILAEDIATGAVETSEILNETILAEDIATGAVETSEILNETILADDIATGAVETSEILNETILAEDIATGAVETSEILDETILAEDIATGAVETSEILNETILAEDIATGAVETSEILNGTILNEDIANGTIDLTTKVTGILPVPNGGTGVASLTDGGILLGGGTGPVKFLAVADSGQIPIGDGTTDPVLNTLTAGIGISITNGAGTITINSTVGGVNSNSAGTVPVGTIANGTTFVSGAIPVPGVVFGNIVIASFDQDLRGCIMRAYVFSANNIKVAIFNGTGVPQTLGTGALRVLVVQ